MRDKALHIIRTYPIFLFLLPVFFVLHGYTENYDFVPLKDALLLTLVYLGFGLLFSGLFWLLYRNFTKANLVAFYLLGFNFFFGIVHDTLKKWFPGFFLSKWIFVLPAAFLLLIVILIALKKTKSSLSRLRFYLNILLLVLIIADIVVLSGKLVSKKRGTDLPKGFTACADCPRPDIYFILADEYAGNTELKELFQFNDSAFIETLSGKGFHVIPESKSNYNYTPFSVASILNMNYLDLEGQLRQQGDLTKTYETIRDNGLLKFLEHQGYDYYNYSVFDFEGQPARVRETFLPVKTRLITAQTFLHRFDKEIRFNFVYRVKNKKNQRILTYANLHNNENIYELTWNLASRQSSKPRFVYAHLMMPHYPYYFDKNGKERDYEKLQEGNQADKYAYVEYLQYTNKKLDELINHILNSSTQPPIIVLMGDHGFRHFKDPMAFKYYFLNMVAMHLPSKNYAGISDTLTGVNVFRTILNREFKQQLPALKDSSSYLAD